MDAVSPKLLDDMLTDRQLAEELGRDERTIKRWRALGKGPACIRLGAQPLTRRSVARAWLLEQQS